jgi:hypothetical protein
MIYFHGWWSIKTKIDTVEDILWCFEQFGEQNTNGRWFYSSTSHQFFFKREEDAMWFTLRWS